MYIDKYTINSYGNEYKGNKTLKNQLLTSVKSKDGNRLKKMISIEEKTKADVYVIPKEDILHLKDESDEATT